MNIKFDNSLSIDVKGEIKEIIIKTTEGIYTIDSNYLNKEDKTENKSRKQKLRSMMDDSFWE